MSAYDRYTDSELIVRLRDNDPEAFAEIYHRYKSLLYLHACRMLQDDEEAKDLVQELFATLWTKRETLAVSTSLDAYLYGSIKNRILNFMAHQKVISRYAEFLGSHLEGAVQSHDTMMIASELSDIIESEVARLPPKMRKIFELRSSDRLSYRQIAEKLDISDKTVKKQVHNALKILRPRLNFRVLRSLLPSALFF